MTNGYPPGVTGTEKYFDDPSSKKSKHGTVSRMCPRCEGAGSTGLWAGVLGASIRHPCDHCQGSGVILQKAKATL